MTVAKISTRAIQPGAITAELIASGSITSADIPDGEITGAKLATTLDLSASTINTITTTGNATIGGDLQIVGNLQVDGTTTIINSTNVSVDDVNITLASGAANAAAANGAGITVDGAGATILYDAANDQWDFNKTITAPSGSFAGTVDVVGNLSVDTNTLFVDTVNNRVGVGTTSPAAELDIRGGINVGDGITTVRTVSSDGVGLIGTQTNHPLAFRINGTERMRLDTSGTLLVGKTTSNFATAGMELSSVRATFTRAGGNPLLLNRLTSDGDIVVFQKDGTAMGSVGTAGGDIYVGNGTNSLLWTGSTILPRGGTGDISDATVDLGNATNRFKDIYLSGAVRLATPSLGNGTLSFDGTTYALVSNSSAAAMTFSTNSTEHMRITPTGQVGIGTNNPETLLQIQSTVSGEVIRFDGTTGINRDMYFRNVGVGTARIFTDGTMRIGSNAGYPLQFETNGSERMSIDASGNVGIGTSSPLTNLHVSVSPLSGYTGVANSGLLIERGNGPAALNIASPNTESGFIWFADQDSASVGNIKYDHTNNTMSFATNAADHMRIDASGNVSIGLPSSASNNYGTGLLSVAKNTFTGVTFASHENTAAINGTYLGLMRSRGSQSSPTNLLSGDLIGLITGQVFNTASSFPYRSSAEIRFEADDNHASGDLPGRITFHTVPDGTTTTIERMRITSAGSVGIGTNSPSTILHVRPSTDTSSSITVDHLSGGNSYGGYVASLGPGVSRGLAFGSKFNSSYVERMRVDPDGNLLIGTTGTLNKNATAFNLQTTGMAAGGSGFTYGVYGGSSGNLTLTANAYPANTGVDHFVSIASGGPGGGGPSEIARFVNNGRVGIGTTNPTADAKMTINGGGLRVGRVVYNWYSFGTNNGFRYHHIKTSLWSGSDNQQTQPTMSMIHIKGYTYDGQTIDSMVGFHNWFGSYFGVAITNNGSRAAGVAPYTSSDGYVVLVVDCGSNYPGFSIDYHQHFNYSYVPITVLASAGGNNINGVY